MRTRQQIASHLRESAQRVAVFVLVIVCHLCFLLLFLQPAIDESDSSARISNKERALLLRFFASPQPIAMPMVSPRRQASRTYLPHSVASTRPVSSSAVQRSVDVSAPPAETRTTSTLPMPAQATDGVDSSSDGGFGQRLREAQRGSVVSGMPGSDHAVVPGMHFVDPMDQGIGAVARAAQHLFGVKSRQCVDVDAWRKLTIPQLVARHITPADVDREDEKYQCNAPPGLHF